jgi:hypothetical protein
MKNTDDVVQTPCRGVRSSCEMLKECQKLQRWTVVAEKTMPYLEMKRPLALSAKIIRRFSTADKIITPADGRQMSTIQEMQGYRPIARK